MDAELELRVAELLCSRLCHELVSPVGAINNGLELMRELNGSVADEALELIGSSARDGANRLQYYRMAFGFAGNSAITGLTEARRLIEGFLGHGRVKLAWTDPENVEVLPISDGWGKLLLNMVAVGVEGLPRGGTLTTGWQCAAASPGIEIAVEGQGAQFDDPVRQALAGTVDPDTLTAHNAHIFYTGSVARRLGVGLAVEQVGDDRAVLRGVRHH
jgi:histidine phosphotransferase ChpT